MGNSQIIRCILYGAHNHFQYQFLVPSKLFAAVLVEKPKKNYFVCNLFLANIKEQALNFLWHYIYRFNPHCKLKHRIYYFKMSSSSTTTVLLTLVIILSNLFFNIWFQNQLNFFFLMNTGSTSYLFEFHFLCQTR